MSGFRPSSLPLSIYAMRERSEPLVPMTWAATVVVM